MPRNWFLLWYGTTAQKCGWDFEMACLLWGSWVDFFQLGYILQGFSFSQTKSLQIYSLNVHKCDLRLYAIGAQDHMDGESYIVLKYILCWISRFPKSCEFRLSGRENKYPYLYQWLWQKRNFVNASTLLYTECRLHTSLTNILTNTYITKLPNNTLINWICERLHHPLASLSPKTVPYTHHSKERKIKNR